MSKHTNLLTNDIYEKIEEYIDRNHLEPHDRLPSERYLSEVWSVNRLTLRDAIEKHVYEGKLYTLHGKGTFVAPPKYVDSVNQFISYSAGWKADGYSVSSRKISFKRVEANKTLSKNLDVNLGTEVFELKRVRLLNDAPLSVETAYIPVSFCPDLDRHDFEKKSLYDTLEKTYGIKPAKQRQVANLAVMTKKESEYLEAKEGDPVFYITGVMRDADGRIVEYSTAVIRADRYALKTNLIADPEA